MNPHHPTARELRVSSALRAIAVGEIKSADIAEVAKRLDMKVSGVEALLWESEWSLETWFRVADALGIDVAQAIEASVVPAMTS